MEFTGLRHAQIEAALALAIGVGPEGMTNLRSSLRNLRNMEEPVPTVPRSNKGGSPITYSRWNALEMLIALKLLALGYQAKHASAIAASIVRLTWPELERPAFQEDVCVFADPSRQGAAYTVCGSAHVAEHITKVPPAAAFVNVTRLARSIDDALKQVVFGE